jgi:hypothetical protein
MLRTKVGKVFMAFNKITSLPERKDADKYSRGNRFQKSLT